MGSAGKDFVGAYHRPRTGRELRQTSGPAIVMAFELLASAAIRPVFTNAQVVVTLRIG